MRRVEGAPIKEIARRLQVSTSSVSHWVRDIALSDEQHAALRLLNPAYNPELRGHNRRAETAREVRRAWQEQGRRDARECDALHQAGCMLFWAEGSKSRGSVKVANADVELLKLFIRFLEASYEVPRHRLTICCQVHLGNGLSLEEIDEWWRQQLELPLSCQRKSSIITRQATSKRRQNKLLHGTGHLGLNSTEIVQRIYGAIQEYGGFDRPEWLD